MRREDQVTIETLELFGLEDWEERGGSRLVEIGGRRKIMRRWRKWAVLVSSKVGEVFPVRRREGDLWEEGK